MDKPGIFSSTRKAHSDPIAQAMNGFARQCGFRMRIGAQQILIDQNNRTDRPAPGCRNERQRIE